MLSFRASSGLLFRRSTLPHRSSLHVRSAIPFNNRNVDDDDTLPQSPFSTQQHRRTLRSWSRKQRLRQKLRASLTRQQEPTRTDAATLPLSYQAMDNTSLTVLGRMDNHGANTEILKRHIMRVDGIAYRDTETIYQEIAKKNEQHMFLLALPYQVGIVSALSFGVLSIPMVFHKGTAKWFNHAYVTVRTREREYR